MQILLSSIVAHFPFRNGSCNGCLPHSARLRVMALVVEKPASAIITALQATATVVNVLETGDFLDFAVWFHRHD